MAATDAGGAQVLRHGTMRARVAGLEAVLADGRVLRRLSGLVKDNAGYDLPALLVGSEGTLAVITAVRLALVEAPGRLVTALLGAASMAEAVDLVSRARRALPGLQAAEVLDDAGMALVREHLALPHPLAGAHPVYVLLETADDVEALAAAIGRCRRRRGGRRHGAPRGALALPRGAQPGGERRGRAAQARRLRADRRDGGVRGGGARRRSRRSAGARSCGATSGTATCTSTSLGLEPDDERVDEAVLALVAEHGGSISAEHGVGVAKRRFLGLTRTPEEVAAMAAVKRALDPAGVLNPGVLL